MTTMKFRDRNRNNVLEDASGRPSRELPASKMDGMKRLRNTASIRVDRIEADPQHREDFDEQKLQDLADSIKKHGQLQPIRVRWVDDRSKYVMIAGERRWRACMLAGLNDVDCVIVDGEITENIILREQIVENALREDLKPTERAKAFRDLMKAEGWNGKQLAENIHVSTSTVSRSMQLLQLPVESQKKVDSGTITEKEALQMLAAAEDTDRKPATLPQRRRQNSARERKIITPFGTVCLKSRRIVTDELWLQALQHAMEQYTQHEAA